MKRYVSGDFVIVVGGEKTKSPYVYIYHNCNLIVHYTERFGYEIQHGSCDEIVTAMKLVDEYFPHKVVSFN